MNDKESATKRRKLECQHHNDGDDEATLRASHTTTGRPQAHQRVLGAATDALDYANRERGREGFIIPLRFLQGTDPPAELPSKDCQPEAAAAFPFTAENTMGHSLGKKEEVQYPAAGNGHESHPCVAIANLPLRTNVNQRNIFDRILEHPALIHNFAAQCEPDDLVKVYSMSKPFRDFAKARWTSMIRANAEVRAFHSWQVLKFKCYSSLCVRDPAKTPHKKHANQVRLAPGFRYLKMICHREATVRGIVRELAKQGHRLPIGIKAVLIKLWFVLDIPDNKRRIGIFHNRGFWTDQHLFIATMFLIKLDMRLADPMSGGQHDQLRQMLLAQRGLTPLLRALKRETLQDEADWMLMKAEWNFKPPPGLEARMNDFLGVPTWRLGALSCESWITGKPTLISVDKLIMRECVRRQLGLHRCYMDMIMWGYNDKDGNPLNPFLRDGEHEDDMDALMDGFAFVGPTDTEPIAEDTPLAQEQVTGLEQ